jgi:hypothetical protein
MKLLCATALGLFLFNFGGSQAQIAPKWLLIQDAFGAEMSFESLLESPAIQEAEILFMGEYHDHVLGHYSQQLVLESWNDILPEAEVCVCCLGVVLSCDWYCLVLSSFVFSYSLLPLIFLI